MSGNYEVGTVVKAKYASQPIYGVVIETYVDEIFIYTSNGHAMEYPIDGISEIFIPVEATEKNIEMMSEISLQLETIKKELNILEMLEKKEAQRNDSL